MTERELREIKRRFRPEKSNIPKIVGCFVNSNKEIVARISQFIGTSDSVVSEKLLGVMKKTLSGTLGANLCNISFSTKQVAESEKHQLLMQLRKSELKDEEALETFYKSVIESVKLEGNYVILLANDIYDVFEKKSDGEDGGSSERFSYVICAVCPVKNSPEALTFKESDSLFHAMSASSLLCSPELGFMFPAFDDRKTNIYSALFYTRSLSESHTEFTDNVFGKDAPMPPAIQKATFNECLAEALDDECSFEVIRSVHTQISEMVESHKESKIPEPLVITKATVKSVLENCGIGEEKVNKIGESLDESFGVNAELTPKNIISVNKFTLETPDVTIKVNPERKELVSTQIINGVEYIMIRATEGVVVNGINIKSENKE
ncbi:MAG: DUF4317 domain-containing protein [Ruminococcaceae bacterium]|nr:DUF4317 domain-containing protein [Oscillospiraceae bacterium]